MNTVQIPSQRWTYRDYLQLDDAQRHEILNGMLHTLPAPDLMHQRVVRELSVSLWDFVRKHQCGEVFWSPVDVILGAEQDTVVQPDVVYVASGSKRRLLRTRGIFGPPQLVIEVISPATISRDRTEKHALYEAAGIAEYWLIDASNRKGEVFALSHSGAHSRFELFSQVVLRDIEAGTLNSKILPGWSVDLRKILSVS